MKKSHLDDLPGFRRRFRVTPKPGRVSCAVEDDYHCMSVLIRHDGDQATAVQAQMHRAPWTTCPGAELKLCEAFSGVALAKFTQLGHKSRHCTHLYDLAILAAEHAFDEQPTVYDILVSDPIEGWRHAEIRRDGEKQMSWAESGLKIIEPDELAGMSLFAMKGWIGSLDPSMQVSVKLLQWGNILASGRSIPLEQQSDATRMPPNCYTFQPKRAMQARRVGEVHDFSQLAEKPLDRISILE